MVMACEADVRARNSKVCETRLAIPSDQDAALDNQVSIWGSFISSFRLLE